MGNSIADHLVYFGVNLQAETWGSCRIVADSHRLAKYKTTDDAGNIVLSKDLSSLKLRTDRGRGGSVI